MGAKMASSGAGRAVVLGANSSRPTGSFRQRPKTISSAEDGELAPSRQRKQAKVIDGCRSLFHTERALRRFAPI